MCLDQWWWGRTTPKLLVLTGVDVSQSNKHTFFGHSRRNFYFLGDDQLQDQLFVQRDPRYITLLGVAISGIKCQCTEVSQIPLSPRDRQMRLSRILLREGSRCFPLGPFYRISYLVRVINISTGRTI